VYIAHVSFSQGSKSPFFELPNPAGFGVLLNLDFIWVYCGFFCTSTARCQIKIEWKNFK